MDRSHFVFNQFHEKKYVHEEDLLFGLLHLQMFQVKFWRKSKILWNRKNSYLSIVK